MPETAVAGVAADAAVEVGDFDWAGVAVVVLAAGRFAVGAFRYFAFAAPVGQKASLDGASLGF